MNTAGTLAGSSGTHSSHMQTDAPAEVMPFDRLADYATEVLHRARTVERNACKVADRLLGSSRPLAADGAGSIDEPKQIKAVDPHIVTMRKTIDTINTLETTIIGLQHQLTRVASSVGVDQEIA